MVRYRYAVDKNGGLADALASDKPDAPPYECLGCGLPLVAKLKGMDRQPHFAHHPGATCSSETYLHRLGKQVFAEVFNNCRERSEPFWMELEHRLVCRKYEEWLGSSCLLDGVKVKLYDLTAIFDELRVERRTDSFVPDVLLVNRARPELRIFIEIAVTHFLSEKKERSSERIIEIPIESEKDLDVIRSRKLTAKVAQFLNFVTESEAVTDSDCQCSSEKTHAFIVYKSGKCCLEESTLTGLLSIRQKYASQISYFRLVGMRDYDSRFNFGSRSSLFRQSVAQARADGFLLKNCYLCKYHGNSHQGDPQKPIYCKCFKKTCNSNEAVECNAFRLPE